MDFGEKLQMLRKQSGLSQEELAAKLEVSRQAISKWEVGSIPDLANIKKISRFFGCTIDSLVFDEQVLEQRPLSQDKADHSFRFPRFPPETLCLIVSALSVCIILVLWIGSKCLDRETIIQHIGHKYFYARFSGFLKYYSLRNLFYLCLGSFVGAITIRAYIQLFVRNKKTDIRYLSCRLISYLLHLISVIIYAVDVTYDLFLFVQIPMLRILVVSHIIMSIVCIVLMRRFERGDCEKTKNAFQPLKNTWRR